ncbi:hypothetical protein DEU56DRAFT_911953 [Suillus clintonianus]|uniref:uncharacterized protein n=1 Tax=Suillus clintonianus TaxID=1904413 RepID=UPI001B862C42|nr:uncharacterized protein DEU56DRAFT_911953 [Suillus clintonianus]KAG2139690.1 hypothetical protein DEU56DRAFT_911953 [Suillus clintonianus]
MKHKLLMFSCKETVKSAITTFNIALVTLALYPISDILLKLKSEEFFHALAERGRRGVPLSTINTISSPAFGMLNSIYAIIVRQCSRFFVAATVGSLIAFATSILAPTALSIQSVLADGDIVALPAGAVANNSVYNTTFGLEYASEYYAENNADFAGSILWAEMSLGVRYNFSVAASLEADVSAFIVPQPLNLPMTLTARWVTDVIGLRPSCTWASTNITQPIIVSNGSSSSPLAGVYLEELDLDMAIDSNDVGLGSQANIAVKNPASSLFNHTTLMPPTDGSSVFLASQCTEGCLIDPTSNYVWLNFTGIPTFTLELPPSMTFGQTNVLQLACLVCKPNAVIETCEVRAEGGAMLSVQPLSEGKQLARQGNLFPLDTTTMLSFALSSMQNAGPSNYNGTMDLGSQPLVKFFFGSEQVESWPGLDNGSGSEFVNVTFLPVGNLSTCFGQMLQSASKGYLGSAYVPARISALEVVFMSSLPLVLISTATFLLLYKFLGLLRLHKKGEEFNLSNIARIIHGSNLPEEMSLLAQEIDDGTGKRTEQDVIGQIDCSTRTR